jgi:hypothetical protein
MGRPHHCFLREAKFFQPSSFGVNFVAFALDIGRGINNIGILWPLCQSAEERFGSFAGPRMAHAFLL